MLPSPPLDECHVIHLHAGMWHPSPPPPPPFLPSFPRFLSPTPLHFSNPHGLDPLVVLILLVLLDYGILFFLVFSLFLAGKLTGEGTGGEWWSCACRWRRSWLSFQTLVFLEVRSAIFRRLMLDTRPPGLFAVAFWCCSRFPRPCLVPVVDTWLSRAWVVSVLSCAWWQRTVVFVVYGGDHRLLVNGHCWGVFLRWRMCPTRRLWRRFSWKTFFCIGFSCTCVFVWLFALCLIT